MGKRTNRMRGHLPHLAAAAALSVGASMAVKANDEVQHVAVSQFAPQSQTPLTSDDAVNTEKVVKELDEWIEIKETNVETVAPVVSLREASEKRVRMAQKGHLLFGRLANTFQRKTSPSIPLVSTGKQEPVPVTEVEKVLAMNGEANTAGQAFASIDTHQEVDQLLEGRMIQQKIETRIAENDLKLKNMPNGLIVMEEPVQIFEEATPVEEEKIIPAPQPLVAEAETIDENDISAMMPVEETTEEAGIGEPVEAPQPLVADAEAVGEDDLSAMMPVEEMKAEADSEAPDEAPQLPKVRKTGFWSRLFRSKKTGEKPDNQIEQEEHFNSVVEENNYIDSPENLPDGETDKIEAIIAKETSEVAAVVDDTITQNHTEPHIDDNATIPADEPIPVKSAPLTVTTTETSAPAQVSTEEPQKAELPEADKTAAEKYIMALRVSNDYTTQAEARDSLIEMGPSVANLVIPLLKDDRTITRVLAILIIRDTKAPEGIPALMNLLNDKNSTVRYHAGLALVKMTGRDVGYHYLDVPGGRARAINRWNNTLVDLNMMEGNKEPVNEADLARGEKRYWWQETLADQKGNNAEAPTGESEGPWWRQALQRVHEKFKKQDEDEAKATGKRKKRRR